MYDIDITIYKPSNDKVKSNSKEVNLTCKPFQTLSLEVKCLFTK